MSEAAERFSRTRLLLGDAGLARLRDAHVAVIGLGAVGSYAVEGLARAGVGHLRLVDFDCVSPSNINRQLYALESTLGQPKHELAARRVLDINPSCDVETLPLFVNRDTVAQVLAPPVQFVVDAIDSLNAKAGLLEACVRAGLPVFSSMGAARRLDPAFIRVADLGQTTVCPLARFVRKRLHKRGIREGVRCVFSIEPVPDESVGEPEGEILLEGERPREPPGRERRPMGSLSCVTGIMGLTLAREVIMRIIGNEIKNTDDTD